MSSMDYGVDKGSACEDIQNCLMMLGAMRRGSGDPQLLEAVSRRLWAALLKLEPKRRALLERAK